jgi:predicted O-methyltransferase YrrM
VARRAPFRVLRRSLGLKRFQRPREGSAPAIANAVRRSRARSWDSEEAVWISRIENRRRVLDESTDSIPRDDGQFEVLGEVSRLSSVSPHRAAVLFAVMRETRARSALELGTCVGVSAAYEAAALRLNEGEPLVTIEASAGRMEVARETFAGLGLVEVDARLGNFQQVLQALAAKRRKFDYAFIDGNHREGATVEYHQFFVERLAAPGAIVVFDDIRWSEGMHRAWATVSRHPEVELAVDLGLMGLVVHGSGDTRQVTVPLA